MRKTRGVWVVVLQMMNRAEAPDNGGGGGWRAGGPVQRRAWHRNTATDQTHARGRAGRAGFEQLDKERGLTFAVEVDGFSLAVAHCAGQRWTGELCGQRMESRRSRQSTDHAVFSLHEERRRRQEGTEGTQ